MAESFDLTCQVSVELLPKYLDDDLPEGQTVRLEQHIMICPGCRTCLEQLRRTIGAVSRLRIGESRQHLWADIAARIPTVVVPADPGSEDVATANPGATGLRVAAPDPDPAGGVVAYKFLAADRMAPFSHVRWPEPSADGGDWIFASAAVGACRRAVHACRAVDLAYWLDQRLWRVELAGEVIESATKIVAERGRLLEPVDGWPEIGRTFIDDCAGRLAELCDWAKENQDHRATRMLRAYVKEMTEDEDTDPASVSYTVAHAAGIVGWLPGEGLAAKTRGERTPFDAERRRQSRWLAGRLGLAG
jgi:anti-sigma factor RsiW